MRVLHTSASRRNTARRALLGDQTAITRSGAAQRRAGGPDFASGSAARVERGSAVPRGGGVRGRAPGAPRGGACSQQAQTREWTAAARGQGVARAGGAEGARARREAARSAFPGARLERTLDRRPLRGLRGICRALAPSLRGCMRFALVDLAGA